MRAIAPEREDTETMDMTDMDMATTDTRESRIDPRRLWRRYIFAIALLLVLVLVSHISARHATEVAAADVSVINDAGYQRMLGQRTLYFATLVREDDDPVLRKALETTIDTLEERHETLRATAIDGGFLHDSYFGDAGSGSLDAILTRFIADARVVADRDNPAARDALARISHVGPSLLLDLQHAAVNRHEALARRNAYLLSAVHRISLIAALLTLLLEIIMIFRPADLATRRTLEALEKKTGALETAREALDRRNRDLAAMRDAAEHDALHDTLTGLANRRFLRRELAERCAAMDGPDSGFALVRIDLDRFKEINDTLGHAAGDGVLVHVADVLRSCLRENDVAARIGGDEFVVLTAGSDDRETLTALATRMVETLAQPVECAGALCSFDISIGIEIGVACDDGSALDPEMVLSNADIALFSAKEKGRNRFEFFTEAMRAQVEESRALGDDLIRAIANDEFFPVYQVQVESGGRSVHGVEALARWRHPEKGEIAPWRFLPVAARLGITEDIDDAILRQSLVDFSGWREAGLDVPNLSVNVSARRLADPELIPRLRAMDIPPGHVSFEVLESVLADRMDDTLRFTLDALDDMGIAIEVDDFGTGHASLLALLSLRPDRLKIARELIDPAPDSPQHRAILESIMQIARSLDTEVVAEGIETEAHAALVEEIGAHQMQGFYFCRPLPEPEAARRIAEITAAAGTAPRAEVDAA